MSKLKIIRYGAWAAVIVLAFVTAVTLITQVIAPSANRSTLQPAAIGGPFELVNAAGETVTEADLEGKPSAILFGFTFCPDVCPTTLSEMQGWIEALGPDADKLNYLFVTVDPERDTPQVMGDYVAAFDERIKGLSGSRQQVDAMLQAYKVYSKKVPLDDGDYTMDHSAAVYLMDADNRFFGTIAYNEAEETALLKLRRLVKETPEAS
ncbi:SCO family protein [Roseibium sp. CAU 1637]|uniref:SCO family protein n=1 Tax=Roseibium limicola TaxID=2816037 RepID=A0A939EPA8_9HYPH|nr:SCO family protein [Roseibium limicola]MBO0345481.1 SCO family protein [Roseibium limicola]